MNNSINAGNEPTLNEIQMLKNEYVKNGGKDPKFLNEINYLERQYLIK